MMPAAANLMNPESVLHAFGLVGVFAVVFAETGLLIGFFLPGDSLLFLAGVAASGATAHLADVHLPLGALLVGTPIAATAGAQLGHYLGASLGRRLFDRPSRRAGLARAEQHLTRFNPARALILGRFVGVVRTFVNPTAGLLKIPARRFFVWNVIGAVLWTDTVIAVGYLAGDNIPGGIDAYLLPVVLTIMFISLLPLFAGILRARRREVHPAGQPGAAPGPGPGLRSGLAPGEGTAHAAERPAKPTRGERPRTLTGQISHRIMTRLRSR